MQSRFTQITQCDQVRQQSTFSRAPQDFDKPQSLSQILDAEIEEESAELNRSLSCDQFSGFSVESEGSEIKLTKQVEGSNVIVRFSVSSSLASWRTDAPGEQKSPEGEDDDYNFSLLSMPEFQIQIERNGKTLEFSCYFEEADQSDDEQQHAADPLFHIDQIVMYEGEPNDTEFSVSTEFMSEDLQDGLFEYLNKHGINEEFGKNLVSFATNYEKKQYIGLMKRLKEFVSK